MPFISHEPRSPGKYKDAVITRLSDYHTKNSITFLCFLMPSLCIVIIDYMTLKISMVNSIS